MCKKGQDVDFILNFKWYWEVDWTLFPMCHGIFNMINLVLKHGGNLTIFLVSEVCFSFYIIVYNLQVYNV
jgi:hypothetical protein